MPRRTALLLLAPFLALGLVVVPAPAFADSYSAPLTTAIADLTVASAVRTGYPRSLFPPRVGADGDGGSSRHEVLIGEADDPATVGSGCSLSGGRWCSDHDQAAWTNPSDVDIDHLVPLAEAWDSGARTWS